MHFDMKKEYIANIRAGESPKKVLEKSIHHHAVMCIENIVGASSIYIKNGGKSESLDVKIWRADNRNTACWLRKERTGFFWLVLSMMQYDTLHFL